MTTPSAKAMCPGASGGFTIESAAWTGWGIEHQQHPVPERRRNQRRRRAAPQGEMGLRIPWRYSGLFATDHRGRTRIRRQRRAAKFIRSTLKRAASTGFSRPNRECAARSRSHAWEPTTSPSSATRKPTSTASTRLPASSSGRPRRMHFPSPESPARRCSTTDGSTSASAAARKLPARIPSTNAAASVAAWSRWTR